MIFLKTGRNIIAALSIVLIVFLFLAGSGTLTSGFHFVDDHEVIKIKSELKSSSVSKVSYNWIRTDITDNLRFRPLYYFHRVIETRIFGSDFVLWSIYTAILCCVSILAFFAGIRNMKFTIAESFVFLFIIFIGPQFSVWWRLGPQESLGMVFLGLAFYFLSISPGAKGVKLFNLLFVIFLILASLTKESFILIIPGMLLLRVWFEKSSFSITYIKAIKRNLILLLPLSVGVAELIYIKYNVGTGYAGIDGGLPETGRMFLNTALYFGKSFFYLFVLLFILLASVIWSNHRNGRRTDPVSFFFFLLLVTPNILLYSGSGMFERYLLPATLGLGYLVVSVLREIKNGHPLIGVTAVVLSFITFLPSIGSILSDAKEFTSDGRATNRLLTSLEKYKNDGIPTLLVADPVISYETSVSLKTFLLCEYNTDLYGYCLVDNPGNPEIRGYIDGWNSYFKGRVYDDLPAMPGTIVFLDKKTTESFFAVSPVPRERYFHADIGESPFALYREKTRN